MATQTTTSSVFLQDVLALVVGWLHLLSTAMEQETLPTVSACAVFTIDPVASLNPETQKDPEAIAACKRLMNKKYVVFISEVSLDSLSTNLIS
jgi:hypothetical protein